MSRLLDLNSELSDAKSVVPPQTKPMLREELPAQHETTEDKPQPQLLQEDTHA